MQLNLRDLMEYTEWERDNWQRWFQQQGESALNVSTGPHGNGKVQRLRDLVQHIFLVEMYYAVKLKGAALPDPAAIPVDTVENLFEFGRRGRAQLREWLETGPADQWDVPKDFSIAKYRILMTPRKVLIHTLLHEIRHWGQVATLLRIAGREDKMLHDFIVSPVLGGEWGVGQEVKQ